MKRTETTIHLGYEVGSGEPVSIPLRHMVVTGQTQEAGKTTTLEALIDRAKLPAVAFVTKRGERSFEGGRRIRPYFRERADWQFVASVLEASMRERLKFERAWIMRASKGATTLAQVQTNVQRLMEKAKGISADVYLTLDAYLEIVVPRVRKVRFAESLELMAGLNVLDLSNRDEFPPELQSLVMRSALEWVYEQCDGTISIIPEAWEFIPQGRGSPVKLSAVELIRKGAGLRNYVWLDSQDIGGVDKELLRSCPVWLLGVQREANEIKRVLGNIPAGVAKPKPAEVATLEKGQFFACFGRSVIKTYVQPAWMSDVDAIAIATGKKDPGDVAHNKACDQTPRALEQMPALQEFTPVPALALSNQLNSSPSPLEKEEDMSAVEVKLDRLIDLLSQGAIPRPAVSLPATSAAAESLTDEEGFYQRFKERLVRESPAILSLLSKKPEIKLTVETVTIEMDSKSLKGRIATLIHAGFFKTAKRHADVKKELERTGSEVNGGNMSTALKDFVKLGFLTDEEAGYLAVSGMAIQIVRSKAS